MANKIYTTVDLALKMLNEGYQHNSSNQLYVVNSINYYINFESFQKYFDNVGSTMKLCLHQDILTAVTTWCVHILVDHISFENLSNVGFDFKCFENSALLGNNKLFVLLPNSSEYVHYSDYKLKNN